MTWTPVILVVLEIKPCGLGSRIRDVEAEWRLRVITDNILWWIFDKQNWRWRMNQTLSYSAKVFAKIWCFWPLTASTTTEVKNYHLQQIHWNKLVWDVWFHSQIVCSTIQSTPYDSYSSIDSTIKNVKPCLAWITSISKSWHHSFTLNFRIKSQASAHCAEASRSDSTWAP